jgi:putative membrane protein
MTLEILPPINATLNATSAVLLVTAYAFVKRRSYRIHASLTISAFLVSSVFLCLYLYHKHLLYQATGSAETSTADVRPVALRYAYLFILLLPHVLLAIAMLPMILTTFFFAATRRWSAHRKLARPTFWIWLYVSVSGVLVYFTLYHLFPHFRTGA